MRTVTTTRRPRTGTAGRRRQILLLIVGTAVLLTGATRAGAEPSGGTVTAERRDHHTGSGPSSLTTAKAVVLGLVEGATEYLPVSSTGHLLVTERILEVGQSPAEKSVTDTYTVVIQIGAIVAVLGIFRKRFKLMLDGVLHADAGGRSLLRSLVVAFVPAAIIGKLFGDPIKEHLLRPWPVVGAWIVGGIVILAFGANRNRFRARIDSLQAIPPTAALAIGAAQTVALWPGTSRSFVTILAALALGCSMTVAVEFSFLLGFVTLSAATALELAQNGSEMVDHFGILNPVVGIAVAGVAAFASVRWMITYLERHSLTIFGWDRIALGLGVGVLLVTGTI